VTHTHPTMSTPDLEAAPSADPGEYARLLKERVAPVLSEGLLLALRDRPTDPPAYLAEFLASKGSGVSVAAALHERQLSAEASSLQAELAALDAQLLDARAVAAARLQADAASASFELLPSELGRRLGEPSHAGGVDDMAHAAACRHETRRVERLVRSLRARMDEVR